MRIAPIPLPATDGTAVDLSSIPGTVVVYTYPKTGKPGKAIDVEAINTYAWYKDSHRWNQVYRVYGSDGSAAGFNGAPKIGINPTSCGWTFIADIDTRDAPGGTDLRDNDRGESGVSIHGEKGALGKYRYLLFLTFVSETQNAYGQEFWAEIDIVGK